MTYKSLPVNALPPELALNKSNCATGFAVKIVMKSVLTSVSVLPSPLPLALNAVTLTSNGLPVLLLYVCVGVLSVRLLSVVPSPQLTVYLFGLPSAVIVRVAAEPAPPAVTSLVNATLLTAVLLRTFCKLSLII